MELGVRVTKMRESWGFGRNRMCQSVNVLGRAIRADFVPQCNMKECRSGRLIFPLSILHILSALFHIQTMRSRETHEFII